MPCIPIHKADIDRSKLTERLERYLQSRESRQPPKIAVFGDYCLDKYLYHYPNLDEKSVETGLIARQIRATRLSAGVGGTIANNLCALGAQTFCFGAIGEDGEGFDLLRSLKKMGANVEGMAILPETLTGTYMKPMRPDRLDISPLSNRAESDWTEENRFDIRNPTPASDAALAPLKQSFLAKLDDLDAAIITDQFQMGSEAVFSPQLRAFLSQVAQSRPNLFVFCDSRFFVDSYVDIFVKCNANEALDAYDAAHNGKERLETTVKSDSELDLDRILRAGEWLVKKNKRSALITLGSKGSLLFELHPKANLQVKEIPSIPVTPPIDVCGAGDATNAAFTFARTIGFSLEESAFLAGVASSITIKRIGETGVASLEEILDVLRNQ